MPNWGQPDWCVDVPLWRGFSAAQGCGVPRLHARRVDGGHRRLCALHKNATTTPAIRRAIRSSSEPVTVLAKRYGIAPRTVRRWRERECGEDRSHTIACRRPWAANGMAEGFNGRIAEVLRSHHTPTAAPIKRRNALLFPEVACLGTSGTGVRKNKRPFPSSRSEFVAGFRVMWAVIWPFTVPAGAQQARDVIGIQP